ncbi:hypothetical protein EDB86DRAFT_2367176 [Lactarius hatsudake]|nr:hypothetical protein EDB86DRAFT_2367176 [Lactarius hatsudake]
MYLKMHSICLVPHSFTLSLVCQCASPNPINLLHCNTMTWKVRFRVSPAPNTTGSARFWREILFGRPIQSPTTNKKTGPYPFLVWAVQSGATSAAVRCN